MDTLAVIEYMRVIPSSCSFGHVNDNTACNFSLLKALIYTVER
jgi:hypothetical protein